MFRSKIGLISLLPILFLVLVSVSIPAVAAIDQPISATAVFNLNGVTGWVRFFHDEPQPLADVLVNLQGLTQDAEWSIRQFPVDETLSPSDRCSDDYLGTVFNPNGAPIVSDPDCSAVSCPVGDLSLRYNKYYTKSTVNNRASNWSPINILLRAIAIIIYKIVMGLCCKKLAGYVQSTKWVLTGSMIRTTQ